MNTTITIRSKNTTTTMTLIELALQDPDLEVVSLGSESPKAPVALRSVRSTTHMPLATWAKRNKLKYHAAHHLYRKFGTTPNPVPGVKRFFIQRGTGNYRGLTELRNGKKVRTDAHIWVELA